MAVITCPGCSRMVNDKWDTCPRCGCMLSYVRPAAKPERQEKTIKPQIDVYVPIGDGARDRGEKLHTLYFNDDGINVGYQYQVVDTFPLHEIISVDCYRGAKKNSAASMAAAGFVLGGVTGAVLGGLAGAADNTSWFFEVCTNEKILTCRLPSESKRKLISKWATQHRLSAAWA